MLICDECFGNLLIAWLWPSHYLVNIPLQADEILSEKWIFGFEGKCDILRTVSQTTYQQARDGFIHFITCVLIFILCKNCQEKSHCYCMIPVRQFYTTWHKVAIPYFKRKALHIGRSMKHKILVILRKNQSWIGNHLKIMKEFTKSFRIITKTGLYIIFWLFLHVKRTILT